MSIYQVSIIDMKKLLLPTVTAFLCLVLTSCGGDEKKDAAKGAAEQSQATAPETPGEQALSILKSVKDKAGADAAAEKITALTPQLSREMPGQEKLNIINEKMLLSNKGYYGSTALEAALNAVKLVDESGFDTEPPLEVDAYEPTPDEE